MLFFFQAEGGIRALTVTGVQTCALPISHLRRRGHLRDGELAGSLSPAAARGRGVALLRALSDGLRVARAGLHYAVPSPPLAHSLVAASAEGRAAAPGGGLDRSENLR